MTNAGATATAATVTAATVTTVAIKFAQLTRRSRRLDSSRVEETVATCSKLIKIHILLAAHKCENFRFTVAAATVSAATTTTMRQVTANKDG